MEGDPPAPPAIDSGSEHREEKQSMLTEATAERGNTRQRVQFSLPPPPSRSAPGTYDRIFPPNHPPRLAAGAPPAESGWSASTPPVAAGRPPAVSLAGRSRLAGSSLALACRSQLRGSGFCTGRRRLPWVSPSCCPGLPRCCFSCIFQLFCCWLCTSRRRGHGCRSDLFFFAADGVISA